MMFFRRKDSADVEQILRTQAAQLDRAWVRSNWSRSMDPAILALRLGTSW
jgi:hypothetical protein